MVEKITLMELYLIETLRAKGVSDAEIMSKVKARNIDDFKKYHEQFDFTGLFALEEAGKLESILENGYEVTFLTFTGLVRILDLKFNKKERQDFKVKDYTVSELQLREDESATLKQILSPNWILSMSSEGVMISPIATPKIK